MLVVAQPDKPAGRGMKLQSPAVATVARRLGLPLLQPPRIRNDEFLGAVAATRPELGIVVAYGKILPSPLLAIPPRGFLNVHASLLPKWRGAAPIQRSIEAGETWTGVTIMRVDEELDHGPMLAAQRLSIGPDEHSPALAGRLSSAGAALLRDTLRDLDAVREREQDHTQATHAAKLEKQEGLIRWSDSAASIYDRFRAFDPWPGVFSDGLKLIDIAPAEGSGSAGSIVRSDATGVVVACGQGAIRLITVQRPGKPPAAAFELFRSGALVLAPVSHGLS